VAQVSASAFDEDKDVRSGVAKRTIDITALFRIRIFPRPQRPCLDRSSLASRKVREDVGSLLSFCSTGGTIHLSRVPTTAPHRPISIDTTPPDGSMSCRVVTTNLYTERR
jgi:hypothetical protein